MLGDDVAGAEHRERRGGGDDAVEHDEPECRAPGELVAPAGGEGAERASREVGAAAHRWFSARD